MKGKPTLKAARDGWELNPPRLPSPHQVKIINAMPGLDAASQLVVDCWADVFSCRSIGMAIGPIPYTAVMWWADRNGCDRDVTDMLWQAIQIVDADYLKSIAPEPTK